MNKKPDKQDPLRTSAEAQLARVPNTKLKPGSAGELLHELQVHQIELEMQNETLRQAQITLKESRDRYVDLYDFAPVGYLTLTREAQIAEVNLTGAALLGVERNKLLHRRFDHLVTPEDQDHWHQHFLRAVQHGERQGCELSLKRGDGSVFHAYLDCLRVGGGNEPSVRIALTEITESKRMEENQRSALLFMLEDLENARRKVEQAHQEWINALDVVDDPIFLHDKQFRILRCNKAYQRCAGIPFHEIIGQLYYEIFPKTGAPLPCCLRAMEQAEEEEEEEVAADGAIYRSRAFSVKGEQGAYLYSMHTLEDITGRKQTEAAFRTLVGTAAANIGAAFFHETVSSLSTWLGVECVIIGELVDGNRVRALAMQLDGKAIEHYEYALPGTPCNSVAHKGYCEYPEGVCQLFPADKDLVDMGAEAYVGTPIRDKNGKAIGVLCAISRHKIVSPPMLKGVFEIIAARAGTEIERKRAEDARIESEEKFRKISESAQDAIIMMGADKRISFWNAAAEQIFGYTAAEALGQELHHLIAPLAAQAAFSQAFPLFQSSGEGPVVGKVIEVGALRKGGKEFLVELSISATRLNGQWHAIGIVRDITERKQAVANLAAQVEELRRWHDVTMGREMRIIDLKREVNELLGSAGQSPRYPSAELSNAE